MSNKNRSEKARKSRKSSSQYRSSTAYDPGFDKKIRNRQPGWFGGAA